MSVSKLGWGYYSIDTEGIQVDPDAGRRIDRLLKKPTLDTEREAKVRSAGAIDRSARAGATRPGAKKK